jgi:hypothetical protein
VIARKPARRVSSGTIAALLLAVLVGPTLSAQAKGSVGTAAGFEDDDGNMDPAAGGFDWNSFGSPTWSGSAPDLQASTSANGWQFRGLTTH